MADGLDGAALTYSGPAEYALADWRRRINDLYCDIRQMPDPQRAHAHWQGARSRLFRDHPMSPVPQGQRPGFGSIGIYPYDPSWRFVVDLEPKSGPEEAHSLGQDGQMVTRPLGRTRGLADICGSELSAFWITGYGGGLFLPFRDATNGSDTYGGGRYLADAIKGADLGLDPDGRLIIDFNFAYTPSCAWNDAFVCPLSPPENTLPVAVTAGERAP
ncbi:MAG: DUF1684 domain-containing protein [Pseudomonadota bacterium]